MEQGKFVPQKQWAAEITHRLKGANKNDLRLFFEILEKVQKVYYTALEFLTRRRQASLEQA